uniref:Cytochrome P450 n=1 Tax=Meloidogyne floridensis TaxID=298350 RepID=A0A915NJT2_9BILA
SVYGIKNGWFNELVISDPVMVKHVFVDKFEKFHGRAASPLFGDVDTKKLIPLFFAKGKRWKRLRAIANPAFSISNLKRVNIKFINLAERGIQIFTFIRYFDELTFDIISRIAMGQKDSRQFNSEFCKMAHDFERHTILEEIVLNCVLFLLAGFDTTSNNLSLMAHYLVIWLNGEELTFYYPFGGGPRICIGLRFAIMETKMILVRLLKTFELKRCLAELKFCGQIVLNPGKVFVELKLKE